MADVKSSGALLEHMQASFFRRIDFRSWIGDLFLASYGNWCVMAFQSGDQRDWVFFATKFKLAIPCVDRRQDVSEGADANKEGLFAIQIFLKWN